MIDLEEIDAVHADELELGLVVCAEGGDAASVDGEHGIEIVLGGFHC